MSKDFATFVETNARRTVEQLHGLIDLGIRVNSKKGKEYQPYLVKLRRLKEFLDEGVAPANAERDERDAYRMIAQSISKQDPSWLEVLENLPEE